MSDYKHSRTDGKAAADLEARLKAALKANLARRKAQDRLRRADRGAEGSPSSRTGQDKDR